jgi:hypothetical protein
MKQVRLCLTRCALVGPGRFPADAAVEQTVLLFLLCKAGEFGEQRMRRREERLFAVRDRRIGSLLK